MMVRTHLLMFNIQLIVARATGIAACPNCDVPKPKKVQSAYGYFAAQYMSTNKAENEPITVVMKAAGKKWSEMTDE